MIASLLTFHIILFGVKSWAIISFIKRFRNYPYMLLWAVCYVIFEAWFLHKFWIDIDLYYYEIMAIIDQCIFTLGLVFYLTKEDDNGKRTN